MPVELTPNGSYGGTMPKMPRPIQKIVFAVLNMMTKRSGGNLLMLTTTGARSGNEHSVPLRWFHDDANPNAWMIVASAGGAAKHPAWYFNLARNPNKIWIEVDQRRLQVQGTSLKGTEYEQMWNKIVAEAATYASYKQKTDRIIPVIRLTPKA